ncbi:MAG TPA: hypothetical protein DDZ91_11995 [Firmicutes bacterium]|jgi:hypothetical protein|nr:hypothetical protein [Bacillota bacterium]
MIKHKTLVGILVCLAVLLFIANPTKSNYVSWAKEQISSDSSSVFEKILTAFLGESLIENSTSTANYLLFSIFTTKWDGQEIKVLGILRNFILIPSSSSIVQDQPDKQPNSKISDTAGPSLEKKEKSREILYQYKPEWEENVAMGRQSFKDYYTTFLIDSEWEPDKSCYLFHIYNIIKDKDFVGHTATIDWYYIYPDTGEIWEQTRS